MYNFSYSARQENKKYGEYLEGLTKYMCGQGGVPALCYPPSQGLAERTHAQGGRLNNGPDKLYCKERVYAGGAESIALSERIHAAMPDAAITTDIIVGFPGRRRKIFRILRQKGLQ